MTERSSRARVALKLVVGVVGAASVLFGAGVALAAASSPTRRATTTPRRTSPRWPSRMDGNLTIAATIANYPGAAGHCQ